MKKSLKRLMSSLALRVLFAVAAIASAAQAHDLPCSATLAGEAWKVYLNSESYPVSANSSWQGLNQSCFGMDDTFDYAAVDNSHSTVIQTTLFASLPDEIAPPAPEQEQIAFIAPAIDLSDEFAQPFCYDGVDCAQLESHYRNGVCVDDSTCYAQSLLFNDEQSSLEVEFSDEAEPWPSSISTSLLDSSCENAGQCMLDTADPQQHYDRPRYIFRRFEVEDPIQDQFGPLAWQQYFHSVMDGTTESQDVVIAAVPVDVPSDPQWAAVGLQWAADLNCHLHNELNQFAFTRQVLAKTVAQFQGRFNSWQQIAGDQFAAWAKQVPPQIEVATPLFVLYQTSGGEPVYIPMPLARQWADDPVAEIANDAALVDQPLAGPSVDAQLALEQVVEAPTAVDRDAPGKTIPSTDLVDVMRTLNSKLKWAGGRMSLAIDVIQDWVSDRIAANKDAVSELNR